MSGRDIPSEADLIAIEQPARTILAQDERLLRDAQDHGNWLLVQFALRRVQQCQDTLGLVKLVRARMVAA